MTILVLVHGSGTRGTGLLARVDVLEVCGLGHGLCGRRGRGVLGREDGLEGVEDGRVGGPILLGEGDVKLNVQVAKVVVAERWHTLAADHLDGA